MTITGCVQGVGFRPFVFRLATKHGLKGSIRNTSSGVIIDVQGDAIQAFQDELFATKPGKATITEWHVSSAPDHEVHTFEITLSEKESNVALALLPDTAMCAECQKELYDKNNRRYRYPFLHCISCGPRFSLFESMPFDRANTTMNRFKMCDACQKEYNDPDNRRFYSQTNCCPECGPKLNMSIEDAIALLNEGKIVAVKNTGAYQLLVDATNVHAVKRLRQLKHRESKPFALLMRSVDEVKKIADVCPVAEQVLTSPAAPIVLIKKTNDFNPLVSCESPYHGIMLPHNALQYLLLDGLKRPLVATSGNISGEPICVTEEEAFSRLSSIADGFLTHNREIRQRLDDSIVHIMAGEPVMIRRARGYIPYAVPIKDPSIRFATGAHQKSAFAFANQKRIYISQHIGDLETAHACRAYDQEIEKWEKLLSIDPEKGIGDKHPAYYTTRYLQQKNISSSFVQHHEAHVCAGMIDNQLKTPFLGIAWDGTGYGHDGTIWGGEAFEVTEKGIKRVASLFPFPLPGGEKAVREPRRTALGLLHAIGRGDEWKDKFPELLHALDKGINSPLCSSMGRLFDGVSALLGCCLTSEYEGHAAMKLEAIAREGKLKFRFPLIKQNGLHLIDWRPLVANIGNVQESAWAFHEALADAIVSLATTFQHKNILLTGGVMQNKLLVELAIAKLKSAGFLPHIHRNIPPNDGGIAVGQLVSSLNLFIHAL